MGLAAGIGPEHSSECEDWLDANGVDSEGLMLVRDDDTDTCGAAEREGGGGEASASAFVARGERKKLDERRTLPTRGRFGRRPRAWRDHRARRPAHDGARPRTRVCTPCSAPRGDAPAEIQRRAGVPRRRKPRTPGRGAPRVSAADSRRRRRRDSERRKLIDGSASSRSRTRRARFRGKRSRRCAPPETSSPRTSWRLCPWWVRARRRSCAAASPPPAQNRVRAPRRERRRRARRRDGRDVARACFFQ